MKTVVIGESSGASMETIMAVYPRHKAVVDTFIDRGEVMVSDHSLTGATWQYSNQEKQPRLLSNKIPLSSRAWSNPL